MCTDEQRKEINLHFKKLAEQKAAEEEQAAKAAKSTAV